MPAPVQCLRVQTLINPQIIALLDILTCDWSEKGRVSNERRHHFWWSACNVPTLMLIKQRSSFKKRLGNERDKEWLEVRDFKLQQWKIQLTQNISKNSSCPYTYDFYCTCCIHQNQLPFFNRPNFLNHTPFPFIVSLLFTKSSRSPMQVCPYKISNPNWSICQLSIAYNNCGMFIQMGRTFSWNLIV